LGGGIKKKGATNRRYRFGHDSIKKKSKREKNQEVKTRKKKRSRGVKRNADPLIPIGPEKKSCGGHLKRST